ncbi:MAG: phosphoribosylglycinamide formyltransferase [Pseudomonadota bacterium]|nr:MAG: phosphoribosylglycinamide formyltransferase [Pseudomonadota bacterium]
MTDRRAGIVVLISGRGSNLQAIIDAVRGGDIPADVRAVISNNPDAAGLAYAKAASIPTEIIDHRTYSDRASFDRALMHTIDRYSPSAVVLAGFMRILTPAFIEHYRGRLLNVHPSLLPAFAGLNTHARALAAGVQEHGATVHFVTPEVDSGPIIVQARVPVFPDDDAKGLAARVLAVEHRILPLAIRWFVEGRLTVQDGRVLVDGGIDPRQGLRPPTA